MLLEITIVVNILEIVKKQKLIKLGGLQMLISSKKLQSDTCKLDESKSVGKS